MPSFSRSDYPNNCRNPVAAGDNRHPAFRWSRLAWVLAALLGGGGVAATQPAGQTKAETSVVPSARRDQNIGGFAGPLEYGADPTGVADSSAAINRAANVMNNGATVNVYLPAGTYYIKDALNIGSGRCLYGDSRGNTTLTIDQGFNPGAAGVIVLTGREQQAPCIHDLDIEFAQPSDQSSRANFKTLAQGCTSGVGGTGCKYPPAIYMASDGANRVKLWNLRIARAWDGINDQAAGGFDFRNIEMSALDVGLTMANGLDFGYVANFEFWPYDILVGTNLYRGVFLDGNTFAAQLGEVDGASFIDFRTVSGRIALTSAFTWGTFTDLKLDGGNATLEIAATTSPGLQIQGVYATGAATGADTHCQIDVASGNFQTTITNAHLVTAGGGNAGTAICVAGGGVSVVGGWFPPASTNSSVALVTGGNLRISDTAIFPNTGAGAWTVPLVKVTGGSVAFTNNQFAASNGDVGALSIATDNRYNIVSGNNFNGWGFTPPGIVGYYEAQGSWAPDLKFGGQSAGIRGTQIGSYWRRGKETHAEYQITLTSKGSSTGAATINGLPLATATHYGGNCTLGYYDQMTAISSLSPYVPPGTSVISLAAPGLTGIRPLTDRNFTNTSTLYGACDYLNAN